MRILTVKRELDVTASGAPLTIYCSDSAGSVELDGILCQKVCALKPLEERTFDIGLSEVELFAVLETDGDRKILARYSIDNALNFTKLHLRRNRDLNDSSEFVFCEKAYRAPRLSSKVVGALCAAALIVFVILGLIAYYWGGNIYWYFRGKSKSPDKFETEEFSITLSRAFMQDFAYKDCYAAYYSPDPCWVLFDTDSFEDMPDLKNMTLSEYCLLFMEVNNDEHIEPIYEDGMIYYVDEIMANDEKNVIYTYFYKTDDAFWFVQFGSLAENADYWNDCYPEWAKSVEFK